MFEQGTSSCSMEMNELIVTGSVWSLPPSIPSFVQEHSCDDCTKCRVFICIMYAVLNPNPYRSKVVDFTLSILTLNALADC
jgi:hypothetical protein